MSKSKYNKRLNGCDKITITSMYLNGSSLSSIGASIGFSQQAVSRHLDQCGLRGRKSSAIENPYGKVDIDILRKKGMEYWYLVGLLLSDGFLKNEKYWILTQSNKPFLDKIKKLYSIKSKVSGGKNGAAYTIGIYTQELTNIISHDLKGADKTYSCTFPDVPDKNIWHFIRGVIDGDGCYYVRDGRLDEITIVSASPDFVDGLCESIYKLGYTPTVHRDKNCLAFYVKVLGGSDVRKDFASKVYKDSGDFKLDRKYNKVASCQKK